MAPYQNYETEIFSDLKELLTARAASMREKTLFLQKRNRIYESIGYRRFFDDVCALGTALTGMGLVGKNILLIGENSYEWTTAFMAVVCGTGCAVPLDKESSAGAIRQAAQDCEAAAVIYAASQAEKIDTLDPDILRIGFDSLGMLIAQGKRKIADGDTSFLCAKIDPDVMTLLLLPKKETTHSAVMLSHRNLTFLLSEIRRMVRINEQDLFLSVLPLHHAYELTCGFLLPLSCGAAVAYPEPSKRLSSHMRELHPTVILCTTALVDLLHQAIRRTLQAQEKTESFHLARRMANALPDGDAKQQAQKKLFASIHKSLGDHLRLLITVGSVNPTALSSLRSIGIHTLRSYGRPECASVISISRDRFYDDASVGMATPNALLDIADPQEDGIGEIRFKGQNLMLGYYRDPDATAHAIRGGWFYTGDLGYLDPDGKLFLSGRVKK